MDDEYLKRTLECTKPYNIMNEQKHIDHLRDVQRHCGGFQHALIEAWFKADGGNRRTIEEAFPSDHRIPIGRPSRVKYARKCSITGEGMNEGYIVGDCTPVKHEKDLIALIRSWDVDVNKELSDEYILAESYKEEEYYYTEWDDKREYQYEEVNGELIEIQ